MEARSYKSRTREEVMAWLQRARERKDAFQKRANEIFAEEERLRQQAVDSHYYDISHGDRHLGHPMSGQDNSQELLA